MYSFNMYLLRIHGWITANETGRVPDSSALQSMQTSYHAGLHCCLEARGKVSTDLSNKEEGKSSITGRTGVCQPPGLLSGRYCYLPRSCR